MRAFRFAKVSFGGLPPPTGEQLHHQNDKRDNEQDVNEAAGDLKTKAERPQNE